MHSGWNDLNLLTTDNAQSEEGLLITGGTNNTKMMEGQQDGQLQYLILEYQVIPINISYKDL